MADKFHTINECSLDPNEGTQLAELHSPSLMGFFYNEDLSYVKKKL